MWAIAKPEAHSFSGKKAHLKRYHSKKGQQSAKKNGLGS